MILRRGVWMTQAVKVTVAGVKNANITRVEIKIHLLYICCEDHQTVASINNRITPRCYARHLTDSSSNSRALSLVPLFPDPNLSKIRATRVRG